MLVYTFEKSFQERLDDFKIILEDSSTPIKINWIDFIEASIEPAGYSAIWKISRASCEEYEIRYPAEVYGVVNETDFDGLSADFSVRSVQDDSIRLPSVCQVPLEDLYPTIEQENSALNVDLTADCLDRYRFFFKYIYLPWDQEDDSDFAQKLLEPRMQLFFDLKNKKISKGLSSHIRGIINEAKHVQQSREQVESSFEDDSVENIDISCGESKEKARKLLQLHFRMNQIKHDIDIICNPEMRQLYEEIKFPKQGDGKTFVVAKTGTLSEQVELINELKRKVDETTKINWVSLQEAIATSSEKSEIFIPRGEQELNFLEYLNGDILISGIAPISIWNMEKHDRYAKISSTETGLLLFAVDGDLRLENLIIDCEKVKTGILINDGRVSIRNCVICGSKDSTVSEAFAISGAVKVLIENCIITNFATAITVNGPAHVDIRQSVIKNCINGVQLLDEDATVLMEKSSLMNCDNGILKYSDLSEGKALDWNDKKEVET